KVRMNLHLESFKLCRRQLRSQSRSAQLAFAIARVVIPGVTHQEDEPVNQEKTIEVWIEEIKRPVQSEFFGLACDKHIDNEMNQDNCAGKDNAQRYMKKCLLTPIVSIDSITAGHPEYERRHQRPQITR